MSKQHHMVRRFGDNERKRLRGLFSQFGTDNDDAYELARGAIDSMLRQFGKAWGAGLIEQLGGNPAAIRADIVGYVAALGSSNSDERAEARRNLAELLARHRKNWSDLTNVLSATSKEAWACDPPAVDPERINPLTLVYCLLKLYVGLREQQEYVAVALWTLHTHVYDRFMVSPRLALRSPVADCGKTTLLDILAMLTARAAKFDSITIAAIFRLIDDTHPTLLIDEADNMGLGLQQNGKLRAVFNSGHRQGGKVAIWDSGFGGYTRQFSTFAPLALALPDSMTGLPRTVNSRSITIMMQRHDGQRELLRFDANHPDAAFDQAYAQILLWRGDVQLDANPAMPAGMKNRFADNWRPLISIADSLGWGTQAREAMIHFAHEFQDADVRILLLGDIRKVFDAQAVDRLPGKVLLGALHALDADWNEFHGVRGDQQPHRLKDTELAAMLREFRIRPSNIWPPNRTADSKSAKGYRRAQFEDAWRGYCGDDGTTAQANNIRSLRRGDSGTA
jgi:Protein of unknown function (DUF3631)